jgi:hypothetical protein
MPLADNARMEATTSNQQLPDVLPEEPPWWTHGLCVRIKWHPSSYRPDEMYNINDYMSMRYRKSQETIWDPAFNEQSSSYTKSNHTLWYPFSSREDFEFAEYVTAVGLSNSEIDSLITLVTTSWSSGPSKISFKSSRDISAVLSKARQSSIQFQEHKVTESYRAKDGTTVTETFSFWCRPLMPVLKDLLSDPVIESSFERYPSKRYLIRNGDILDLIDDVDCGSDWWDGQVRSFFVDLRLCQ